MHKAKIYGVGLGPGSPDLMSVRSDHLIRQSKYVAYFRKKDRKGHAISIAEGILRSDVVEIPMEYPVTTEIPIGDPRYKSLLSSFYKECTDNLLSLIKDNHDVIVLCEGDPFFYGSFMHLYTRFLEAGAEVSVVPGITGMSGAWTASGIPITWGDDVLTVLMGTLEEPKLIEHISITDSLVVMKIGRNLDKVRRAVISAGKLEKAFLVEYASMENEKITPLSEVKDQAPYFSILIIHGNGRRP